MVGRQFSVTTAKTTGDCGFEPHRGRMHPVFGRKPFCCLAGWWSFSFFGWGKGVLKGMAVAEGSKAGEIWLAESSSGGGGF